MEVKRTDDQILSREPLSIRFGDRDYSVPILTIKKSRAWRQSLVAAVNAIGEVMKGDAASQQAFVGGLAYVFLDFPDKMADLVFAYAPDLPREEIEEHGTDDQLVCAFSMIVQVSFPFMPQLETISRTIGLAAPFPASARSTKPH